MRERQGEKDGEGKVSGTEGGGKERESEIEKRFGRRVKRVKEGERGKEKDEGDKEGQ